MASNITRTFFGSFSRDTFWYHKRLVLNGSYTRLPTHQDAYYYGVFYSETEKKIITWCEGDETTQTFDTEQDFGKGLTACIEWHRQQAQ